MRDLKIQIHIIYLFIYFKKKKRMDNHVEHCPAIYLIVLLWKKKKQELNKNSGLTGCIRPPCYPTIDCICIRPVFLPDHVVSVDPGETGFLSFTAMREFRVDVSRSLPPIEPHAPSQSILQITSRRSVELLVWIMT